MPGVPGVDGLFPDLPDDLTGVVDRKGVVWFRLGPDSPMPGSFAPDDPLKIERLPPALSWYQLLVYRSPVAEYRLLPAVEEAA